MILPIFVALVHHPVLTRDGQVGTTALTNVDIHDLARSCRTYGVRTLYLVTPVTLQLRMIEEVVQHWTGGEAGDTAAQKRRGNALERAKPASSVQAAMDDVLAQTGRQPRLVVTGARMAGKVTSYDALAQQIRQPQADDAPILLLFGTGWGLAPSLTEQADIRLPPLLRDPFLSAADDWADNASPFNHLSVRAAAAIILDRLLGDR
jgi:hypothetical protein